jgi:hypothetical protein
MNQLKGFLDSLGVQLNASIIWNAVPYSFAADWFFGVGEWINSLRTDNLTIPTTVLGFCHSLKWEYVTELEFLPSASYQANSFAVPVASKSFRNYERRVDIPSIGLFDTSVKTPNMKQWLLGAALTIQRF